ncbi:MAG: hypothetical protein IIW34_07245 [Clostridia bacterium]|nr:hypothetical protein [Clostridia bacterium]MBQ2326207.1 hypothetical protein [Clostridia bacterium]MBQ5813927.1 hypothetical protein [Clostridia bacterium]
MNRNDKEPRSGVLFALTMIAGVFMGIGMVIVNAAGKFLRSVEELKDSNENT